MSNVTGIFQRIPRIGGCLFFPETLIKSNFSNHPSISWVSFSSRSCCNWGYPELQRGSAGMRECVRREPLPSLSSINALTPAEESQTISRVSAPLHQQVKHLWITFYTDFWSQPESTSTQVCICVSVSCSVPFLLRSICTGNLYSYVINYKPGK